MQGARTRKEGRAVFSHPSEMQGARICVSGGYSSYREQSGRELTRLGMGQGAGAAWFTWVTSEYGTLSDIALTSLALSFDRLLTGITILDETYLPLSIFQVSRDIG